MTSNDETDVVTFDEGFATLALPMGGTGTPRLPVPADPTATAPDGAQRIRLRDGRLGDTLVPCYGLDPT